MSENSAHQNLSKVLLVEDNPAHAEIIRRCFEYQEMDPGVHHVSNGDEALDYLFSRNQYASSKEWPLPKIIILDLKLPTIDGFEVLKEIKQSANCKSIPVIMLTTSKSDEDMAKAYNLNVNSYLVKPVDFNIFTKLIADFGMYWLNWNQAPEKN